MATVTSVGSGAWETAGTWDIGVPGDNDEAIIAAGHTVTLGVADQCHSLTVNGTFVQNADLTFTDSASCRIIFNTASGYSNNGTQAAPRIIKSASANPTYPWYITCYDVTGADSRTLTFTYIEFQGAEMVLGNDGTYQWFNGPATNEPIITQVTPSGKVPSLIEHGILGRTSGRVYPRAIASSSLTVSGTASKDAHLPSKIDAIIATKQRISLFTRYHHLPKCRIEREPQYRDRGGNFIEFTISVREDV
jgi:hypothetical protein